MNLTCSIFRGGVQEPGHIDPLVPGKKLGSIDPLAWHPAKSIYSQSVII